MPFEDGADDVTPVITRAMAVIEENGRALPAPARAELESAPGAGPDFLTDLAAAMRGERRVRTQVVLGRLAAQHPTYAEWTLIDLRDALVDLGFTAQKSDGRMVVRAEDITAALRDRTTDHIREATREGPGSQGVFPDPSLTPTPCPEQRKHGSGRVGSPSRATSKTPGKPGVERGRGASLPDTDADTGGGGQHDS